MATEWLYRENLAAFISVLGWLAEYDTAPDELTAIDYGVRETNAEADQWYEYEFVGLHRIAFSLAADPGTSVVHVRIEAPTDLKPKIDMAIAIFAHFHLQQLPNS